MLSPVRVESCDPISQFSFFDFIAAACANAVAIPRPFWTIFARVAIPSSKRESFNPTWLRLPNAIRNRVSSFGLNDKGTTVTSARV